MRYDVSSDRVEEVSALPHDGPDFVPLFEPDGALRGFFTGAGASLLYKSARADDDWTAIADIGLGYSNISRIAVSDAGDWITLVVETGEAAQ